MELTHKCRGCGNKIPYRAVEPYLLRATCPTCPNEKVWKIPISDKGQTAEEFLVSISRTVWLTHIGRMEDRFGQNQVIH